MLQKPLALKKLLSVPQRKQKVKKIKKRKYRYR
jgi:hypothetical protein